MVSEVRNVVVLGAGMTGKGGKRCWSQFLDLGAEHGGCALSENFLNLYAYDKCAFLTSRKKNPFLVTFLPSFPLVGLLRVLSRWQMFFLHGILILWVRL